MQGINLLNTEGLLITVFLALDGGFFIACFGKKREKDFCLPKYLAPQPSEDLLPHRRSLARKARGRDSFM